PGQTYHVFEPPAPCPPFDGAFDFEIEKAGMIRGLAGWFEAQMGPIVMCTEPGVQSHWGQQLFPLPELSVEPGDRLVANLALVDEIWKWSGELRRNNETITTFELEGLQWRTNIQ
ncbi:MAG: hypothetical protein ACI9OJ_004876, partial [Myxococcota bacterium]